MKILIIEDEILIQQSIKILLTNKGHDVSTTSSGLKAVELIKNNNFDKIICDLMLNDISGFEVIDEYLNFYDKEKLTKTFSIITAYNSDKTVDKINSYGCTYYSKPFSDIHQTINNIIEGNHDTARN